MTALEYIMPQGESCIYDYGEYCWVEKEYLPLLKKDSEQNDLPYVIYDSRCQLLEPFTTHFGGTYLMDKETRDKLDAIELIFDERSISWDSCVRRPYYRIRGPKVTEQQAAEIIDAIVEEYNEDEDDKSKICFINIRNPVFADGTIGENYITSKYPNINEVLQDVLQLKLRFPYLDFVMAISGWNELPNDAWDKGYREYKYIRGELQIREYENFTDDLQIGIWVHDNKIEILNEERAAKKYEEYDRLYSDRDIRKYYTEWLK